MNRNFLFWLVVAGNLAGAFYGFFFYYSQQLMQTPLFLAVFVPDCPLAALFFAISLIGIKFNKRFHWFYFLSFAFCLKYGFWTVFVLLKYNAYYFTPEASFMYGALFASHILLFAEQFLLLNRIEVKKLFFAVALVFLLANDFSDYFLGTHPPLPSSSLQFMFPASIAMTLFFSLFSFWILRKKFSPLIEIF